MIYCFIVLLFKQKFCTDLTLRVFLQSMGNSQQNVYDTYQKRVEQINSIQKNRVACDSGMINLWPIDVLSLIISYSCKTEQIRIVNALFNNLQLCLNELHAVLSSIDCSYTIDEALMMRMRNAKKVLNVEGYRFYANNIALIGKMENINYLRSNQNNIIYALLFYISFAKKDILKRNRFNQTLHIDAFIESAKKNPQNNKLQTIFEANKEYVFDDNKSENVEYKTKFTFDMVQRICIQSKSDIHLSWQQWNDLFIEYLVREQYEHCCDEHEAANICSPNSDMLGIMMGCSVLSDPLHVYRLNIKRTKHLIPNIGGASFKHYKKTQTAHSTTTKCSHLLIFSKDYRNINVITMSNKHSLDHIKQKSKISIISKSGRFLY